MKASPGRALLVSGALGATGSPIEVLVVGGSIVGTGPCLREHCADGKARTMELPGFALLAAAAEPHCHLDKAFAAGRAANPAGDLRGAVRAQHDLLASMTLDDIAERASRAIALAVRHGFTALRTHVSVAGTAGMRPIEALVSLRRELIGVVDLQLVAMVAGPLSGRRGRAGRDSLTKALEQGADVVGGAPWLSQEPASAVDELTAAAAGGGHPIDLHIDETTDAGVYTLERYLERVERLGLGGRAVASHCVSLGQQPLERARSTARAMASCGVGVVVLPQTNLVLQGRGTLTCTPRGLAPVQVLEEAGVVVAAGGDNWRDPFNPLGRADPIETAALLVAAGHLSPEKAYEMVSERARALMGLRSAALRPGDQADLLAISAGDVADAVAGASEQRIVFHRGRVVAWTEVRSRRAPPVPRPRHGKAGQ